MSQFPLIAIFALFAIVGGGIYLFYKRRRRNQAIADILSGTSLLGLWTYSAAEWRQAVADEFSWAKAADGGGEVYISQNGIYVKSASADRLIDLGGEKVVTHASYRGAEGSPLKIRVRWKVRERDMDGNTDRIKYYKEDYRIPVPLREREAAMKVAEWFSSRLENNLKPYTDVVGEDEAISIFGNDSF